RNLGESVEAIHKASGQRPRGFRAPAFALPDHADDIYALIDQHFDYDSSCVLRRADLETGDFRNKPPFSGVSLTEFPLVSCPLLGRRLNLRSGGTFWRLFSAKTLKRVMDYGHDAGFVPVVYLHPYDYLTGKEFWVRYRHLENAKGFRRLKLWLRQHQWLGLGNASTLSKLDVITEHYEPIGPMGSGLRTTT
ncbi:MAG: DUF3473 domain-containing protein, partial [Myxococcota bacterium]|nr:DUF3473 domain-containing protein [Myxococcota bacterium]